MKALKTLTAALLLLILVVPVVGAAPAATPQPDDGDETSEDDVTVIDLSGVSEAIEELADALREFTGSWDATLRDLLVAVLFKPFYFLIQQLIRQLTLVLTNTPSIYPNPAVESVHRDTLLVAYALAGLAFPFAGVLYMYGSVLGVNYREVRMILPRIIAALIFATVSLPLLQYTVELSDAVVYAFAPKGLTASLTQIAGTSVALVIVWVINAALLLVLVAVFIIRNVYLLFVAAISPLLALAWSLPNTKRYADTFISGYWAALAMAPLDVLALKFVLSMLEMQGPGFQGLSNWILGVAGFALLLWIPYQLYGASQAILGQAYQFAGGVKKRVRQQKQAKKRQEFREKRLKQGRAAARGENKFNRYGGSNDD